MTIYRITIYPGEMPTISFPRTSTGRVAALSVIAIPIGVLGALSAWVLVKLIGLLTSIALFQRVSTTPPPMSELHPGPWLFLVAAAGGLAVSLIARWVPTIRGHGIPEAMEAVVERQSVIYAPTAIGKTARGGALTTSPPRSESRLRHRSRSAPAARSARKDRSSLPGARSAHCSGRGCPSPRAQGGACSRAGPAAA